jgi:hypothetical protein
MDDDSKEKTAFIVDNNVYEWNRLAFGLTNASSTFQAGRSNSLSAGSSSA